MQNGRQTGHRRDWQQLLLLVLLVLLLQLLLLRRQPHVLRMRCRRQRLLVKAASRLPVFPLPASHSSRCHQRSLPPLVTRALLAVGTPPVL